MKQKISNFFKDSLFRNSFYLMLATAVMAGFGFFFWLINAKLFLAEDIGIATTLISVMGLISYFSLVGFGTTFVRYLPNSEEPNNKLNTGIIIVGIATLILSSVFVCLVKIISPKLGFIIENPLIAAAFIFFCIMMALNILTDSVFLAYRQTKYTLIINTIFSAIKMVLPFAFIRFGALGIFLAAAFGQMVGFALSIAVMIWKMNYRPKFIIKLSILKEVWRYSLSNYFAGVLATLPVSYLPVLITNKLGAKESAYFYIVMMIGNLLYAIPRAATSSLFAEGSNDDKSVNANIKKSIKIMSALLIPSILILIFGGQFILGIFGKNYASGGADFLRYVAVAAITVGAYSLFNTLFSIKKDLSSIIFINILFAGSTILLSYILLPFGLAGIGFAWLAGNGIAGLLGFFIFRQKHHPSS